MVIKKNNQVNSGIIAKDLQKLDGFKDLHIKDIERCLCILQKHGKLSIEDDTLYVETNTGTDQIVLHLLSNGYVWICADRGKDHPEIASFLRDYPQDTVINLNGYRIDSSRFVDHIFHQSIKYDWNSRTRKRENEHLDIMYGKDLPLQEAISIAKNFLQQYVPADEIIWVVKNHTSFDYRTDCHHYDKTEDKGTLNQLFRRLMENSNLDSSISSIGRLTFTCKKNSCEVWFREHDDGYNYSKIFEFKSPKNLFPKCEVEIRDKWQCVLDKRERSRIQNRGHRW